MDERRDDVAALMNELRISLRIELRLVGNTRSFGQLKGLSWIFAISRKIRSQSCGQYFEESNSGKKCPDFCIQLIISTRAFSYIRFHTCKILSATAQLFATIKTSFSSQSHSLSNFARCASPLSDSAIAKHPPDSNLSLELQNSRLVSKDCAPTVRMRTFGSHDVKWHRACLHLPFVTALGPRLHARTLPRQADYTCRGKVRSF